MGWEKAQFAWDKTLDEMWEELMGIDRKTYIEAFNKKITKLYERMGVKR